MDNNNYYQPQQPFAPRPGFQFSSLLQLTWKNLVIWAGALLFVLFFIPIMSMKITFFIEMKMRVSGLNMMINRFHFMGEWGSLGGGFFLIGFLLFLIPIALIVISLINAIANQLKAILTIVLGALGFILEIIAFAKLKAELSDADSALGELFDADVKVHVNFFYVLVILLFLVVIAAGVMMIITKRTDSIKDSIRQLSGTRQVYATPVQPVATPVQPVATPVQPVATPVQPTAAPTQEPTRICKNCGSPVTGKFCAKCGTPIES
ncbi:zinc ribbon domain-containing protein [Agathobacter ruminis]|uniref:Uncharacterized protein n=1 Tax=Agathobacter ruminis TaxID=1712665 RepID=A0A2G3E0T1_9FIRM|nr:zinc ribbon domain-containing protein [Agathobacter ruminis]MDC7300740.1 hypothetical protein [Agathobacter ruminis]PHU36839.1 hypothetical protein CSX02_10850 [Agathobacter ruminis]